MSRYFLHSDIYACEIDAGAMFLDLARLKYFAVESQYVQLLRLNVVNWPKADGAAAVVGDVDAQSGSSELLEDFARQGMLTVGQNEGTATRTELIPADRTIMTVRRADTRGLFSPKTFLDVARAALYVSVQLRRRRLNYLVKRHMASRPGSAAGCPGTVDMTRVRKLMASFQQARPWLYTAAGACLHDSLTVVEFLRYNGIVPTLVIGVLTNPFEAHAWVQINDVVLNDTVEHVREYTPILAA